MKKIYFKRNWANPSWIIIDSDGFVIDCSEKALNICCTPEQTVQVTLPKPIKIGDKVGGWEIEKIEPIKYITPPEVKNVIEQLANF
jgi:hypothetical protein